MVGFYPAPFNTVAFGIVYVSGPFSYQILDNHPVPDINCAGGFIGDGRINDGANELGAPLAAYCNSDGGIDVYSISKDSSEGTLAFSSSADDIANALDSAASGGASVLVGEGNGDQLWASPDGTLAVTGPDLNGEGKTYRFDFAGDRCG
jgi:hypothetical protein